MIDAERANIPVAICTQIATGMFAHSVISPVSSIKRESHTHNLTLLGVDLWNAYPQCLPRSPIPPAILQLSFLELAHGSINTHFKFGFG
jgi:hypothetical protein